MMYRDTTFDDLDRKEAAVEFVLDEEAFRGFYERNARGIWAYLVRTTGDREQADDLLQETFYRFLRAGAAHESERHRRNSLYRIATNLARDARRRKLVRGIWAPAEEAPAREKPAEGVTDLTRALSSMKPRERAMLWLAYAEGATHEEIAGALGLRRGSLKTLLFRARRKLEGLLGQGGER